MFRADAADELIIRDCTARDRRWCVAMRAFYVDTGPTWKDGY